MSCKVANKIKSVAYSSQENHTGQLEFATDWRKAAGRDNVISITLKPYYKFPKICSSRKYIKTLFINNEVLKNLISDALQARLSWRTQIMGSLMY